MVEVDMIKTVKLINVTLEQDLSVVSKVGFFAWSCIDSANISKNTGPT